jgi:pimeloyl-ACP methyl ester carboxylesterase
MTTATGRTSSSTSTRPPPAWPTARPATQTPPSRSTYTASSSTGTSGDTNWRRSSTSAATSPWISSATASRSPPPGQGVTFDDQAAALVGFLDALGTDRVDLVANDSGVGIAQIFAVHHPSRLRSLVLTNGDVHDSWPPAEFAGFTDRVKAGELPEIIQRFHTDHDAYRAPDGLGGAYQLPDQVADADIDTYITPYIANPAQMQDLERFILAFDPAQTVRLQDRLKQLTTPTAIVWGTGDIFFDEHWSHWLAATIPGTRTRTSLEGARLLLPEECPGELSREILRLWELDQ